MTGLALALAAGILAPAQEVQDPVMRARQSRAQAQGISEADLPPVPRGVVEPPPLPPPETSPKDLRRARRAKGRKGHGGSGRKHRRVTKRHK